MRPKLILNDAHLGVQRMAGTTPVSQLALRHYLITAFERAIMANVDKDLIIAGDLFDGFTVDIDTVLDCYFALSKWMSSPGHLYLMAGNHDIGKRSDRTSSFDVLASLLVAHYPERVTVIKDGLVTADERVHMIPHCMNQDLFNIELEKALHVPAGVLILHANIDNGFAENSDHSLNVDAEQLTRLSKKHVILFAHEHQHRVVSGYKQMVLAMGNQWPSSVSDCLAHGEAQKDGRKFQHVVKTDFGSDDINIVMEETWKRDGDFVEMPWDELVETTARFVRITGSEPAERASDVISAIAKYRSKSPAFVVTNGVKIEGIKGMDDITELNCEQVKSFDVLGALLEMLDAEEQKVVKELLA